MSTPVRNLELEAAAFTDLDDLDSWRVYADWLLSVGDPHGELVNLELARRDTYRAALPQYHAALDTKRREHAERWREWANERGLQGVAPKFTRGFVSSLSGELSKLAPVLDELFEREPIQRLLLLDADDDALMQLCQASPPWFARLRYLKISGELGALGAAALAQTRLTRLEGLNLLGNQLDAEACEQLATLDTADLQALTLTANAIDDDALARLLASPTRSQWQTLHLSGNPIDAAGIATLAATRGLDRLRHLSLRNIEANFAGLAPLIDADWPELQRLELNGSYWSGREVYERLRARWGDVIALG